MANAGGIGGNRTSASNRDLFLKAPKKPTLPEQWFTSQGVNAP
jgi:hypothetical protein